MNELVRDVRRAKYTSPVNFIDIADERTYCAFACPDGHVHVRLSVPGCPETDMMFKEPEDAYWFADALLNAYDKAIEDSKLLGHKSRIRSRR